MIRIENIKRIVKYVVYNVQAIFLYIFSNADFDVIHDNVVFITHNLGGGTKNYVKDIQQKKSITILRKIGFGRDFF